MEELASLADSPATAGGPLQMATPDRVNQRRDTLFGSRAQASADGTVHDKISQFNSMSMQSRQHERKGSDAALKRAVLGREEAETEMRRLKDEARVLRQEIEEGKERERRVGERLETIMENYGRAKETHAHTQDLWEKEIRRARKENFKAQSSIVKLQEDIKATRASTQLIEESLQHEKDRNHAREEQNVKSQATISQLQEDLKAAQAMARMVEESLQNEREKSLKAQTTISQLKEDVKAAQSMAKIVEESLQRERDKSRAREQETFEAKYQASNLQDQLEQALARITLVEQERDAYKVAAKNEEVARLAAEGRIPLPAEDADDEFASPPRKRRIASTVRCKDPRVSLSTMEVVSSAASELEIEQLTEQLQWERQRADRAQEMIEFMQAECQMNCCPCSKSKRRTSMMQQLPRATPEKTRLSLEASIPEEKDAFTQPLPSPIQQQQELKLGKVRKGARRSTVFIPKEGVFRTVSEEEAIELEAQRKAEIVIEAHEEVEPELLAPQAKAEAHQRTFARTPSAEPSVHDLSHGRSSLMSLINDPRIDAQADSLPNLRSIPAFPDNEVAQKGLMRNQAAEEGDLEMTPAPAAEPHHHHHQQQQQPERFSLPRKRPAPDSRSSSKSIYTVTTTTSVPVRDERPSSSLSFTQRARVASNGSNASFDTSDPAMTPTMTREEALAKIEERRGRARSATRGASGSQSRPTSGMGRRDMSRAASRATSRVGSRSRSRNE